VSSLAPWCFLRRRKVLIRDAENNVRNKRSLSQEARLDPASPSQRHEAVVTRKFPNQQRLKVLAIRCVILRFPLLETTYCVR
jgi:hypothetical protein